MPPPRWPWPPSNSLFIWNPVRRPAIWFTSRRELPEGEPARTLEPADLPPAWWTDAALAATRDLGDAWIRTSPPLLAGPAGSLRSHPRRVECARQPAPSAHERVESRFAAALCLRRAHVPLRGIDNGRSNCAARSGFGLQQAASLLGSASRDGEAGHHSLELPGG